MMSTRIDSMMGALSETQQRPIRRHRGYIEKNGWNIFSIPKDDLFKMKRDCGTERASILLGCSPEQISERLAPGAEMRRQKAIGKALDQIKQDGLLIFWTDQEGVTRCNTCGKRATQKQIMDNRCSNGCGPLELSKPKTLDLMEELKHSLGLSDAAKEAAAAPEKPKPDYHLAVRLDSLKPGQRFRTPYDEEGLGGTEGTLVRIGTGSASVRSAGTRRSMTVREPGMEQESKTVEFDAPGRVVSWACASMVIPIEG